MVVVPRVPDAGGLTALPENEPNDSPASAQELSWAGSPLVVAVAGRLASKEAGKGGDVDVFRLPIPGTRQARPDASGTADRGGRRLAVEAIADPASALTLELLDANLLVAKSLTGRAGESLAMPNLEVTPGVTYYLRVKRAVGSSGKPRVDAGVPGEAGYRLTALLLDFEPADEREPNDRMESANDLVWQGPSALGAGLFGGRRDEDWFRLPTNAIEPGRVLNLELEGVDGVAAVASVHDSAGKRIAGVRGRKGEKLNLRNLGLPGRAGDAGAAADPPVGYVVVRAESGADLEHRYVLRVETALPDLGGFEAEPNDDPSHASALAEGRGSGYLTVGDVDFFRIQAQPPCQLEVRATVPARVRAKLDLLSSNDMKPLAPSAAVSSRQPLEVLAAPCPAEPVLIRLSQGKYDGNAGEPYALTVTTRSASSPFPERD